MKTLFSSVAAGILLAASARDASALTYGMDRITSNSSSNVEEQFKLTLTSTLSDQVLFKIENLGPLSSVITAVYFDDALGTDAVLNSIFSISGGPLVNFTLGGSPRNLPAGKSIDPDFEATSGLTVTANSPSPQHGVGVGESLSIFVNLKSSKTFEDVAESLEQGALRMGMHVQALPDGQSDSFINLNLPFPEIIVVGGSEVVTRLPDAGGTLLCLGFGFLGLHLCRKGRS